MNIVSFIQGDLSEAGADPHGHSGAECRTGPRQSVHCPARWYERASTNTLINSCSEYQAALKKCAKARPVAPKKYAFVPADG